MNCRFTVVKTGARYNGVNPVRTESVEGYAPGLPEKGRQFVLYGESLTKDESGKPVGTRRVNTSLIKEIVGYGIYSDLTGKGLRYWHFVTMSGSVYRVEELPEVANDG